MDDADLPFVLTALNVAKAIQTDVSKKAPLPSEPAAPADQPMLPHSLVKNAGGFLQSLVYQINATYSVTAYDACAVMIRKLIESLIIDCFEKHNIAPKIIDPRTGEYVTLKNLVTKFLAEKWPVKIGRNVVNGMDALKDLKGVGDLSAHSRHYMSRREYIDELKRDLRVVTEFLLHVAGYRT